MRKCALFLSLVFIYACAEAKRIEYTELIQPATFALSKIMMHDVVNPPAASRYYAYCMLGAYDIVSQYDSLVKPLPLFVKNYTSFSVKQMAGKFDYRIAALYCILETGKTLLPSGYLLDEDERRLIDKFRKNKTPENVIKTSIAVAVAMVNHIISFAKTDNYNFLSAKRRYTPTKGDQYWYPTPPAYIEAVEPNWRIIRPLVMESSDQFTPPALVPFSKDTGSSFYKLAKEVYDSSINQSTPNINIANFWDCNPFAVSTAGHMMLGFKKISPGGHWINIAGIAAANAKLSFGRSVLVQTIVSIVLMDAFINCWDEKYRSNRIRPETFINRYIDVKWQPVLQTPPFPEYTSGHSVISTAAAETLTYFLGDHFSFTDDSEIIFEIPPRKFSSFREAAQEASISRLYGGIHYRDAIVNGQVEGNVIAKYILEKIRNVGIQPKNK